MSKVKVYWIDENGDRKDVDLGGEGYVLPTASTTTKGGIKIGPQLVMNGATLENFTLGTAPQTVEGGMWIAGGAS